jgi:hypothetical protein
MVMSDLTTSGSSGLALATQSKGAEMVLSYDDYCEWNNGRYDLEGLDISEVRYTGYKPQTKESDPYSIDTILGRETRVETFKELESGQYRIQVVYQGKESSVIITNTAGKELSRADNVDLSGSGIETVAFDVGIEIDIEKSRKAYSSFDKYDFETKGAATLYANLDYARVTTYDLAGSSQTMLAVSRSRYQWCSQDAMGILCLSARRALGRFPATRASCKWRLPC